MRRPRPLEGPRRDAAGWRRRLRGGPACVAAWALGLLVAGAAPGCGPARDLEAIRADGRLVALLPYNATTYFLYRGAPMGYEYELLRAFARDRELALEVTLVKEPARILGRLRRGAGDVAAARLIPAFHRERGVAFTEGLYRTRLALVQREEGAAADGGEDAGDGEQARIEAREIGSPDELAGRTVHVPQGSAALDRLVEIRDELDGDLTVVEVADRTSVATLMRRVARGEIELTATQRNLARLKASRFSNLVVRPALGPVRQVAWALREGSPALREALDAWITDPENEDLFEELYFKYFVDRRGYRERVRSEYLTSETGRLSRWDPLIHRQAERLGWDWRLLASQVFQESRFRPRARSWAGAAGLMQLMPATARAHGVQDPTDPTQSLRGGVSFLLWLQRYWEREVDDPAQRLRFVLASYNVGQGHVQDARRLAARYGGDDERWDDVASWLLQKSKRRVYTDPVVRHGFCRGIEPVTYVTRILERWAHYRLFVPAVPEDAEGADPTREAQRGAAGSADPAWRTEAG